MVKLKLPHHAIASFVSFIIPRNSTCAHCRCTTLPQCGGGSLPVAVGRLLECCWQAMRVLLFMHQGARVVHGSGSAIFWAELMTVHWLLGKKLVGIDCCAASSSASAPHPECSSTRQPRSTGRTDSISWRWLPEYPILDVVWIGR